jgi:hypothetical protein
MTYRWTANTAVADAVSLLEGVPTHIGDWTATDHVMTENEVKVGRIDGYVKREYMNGVTGARVHFLLMCGESGPISLHPPTVCFSGQGYHVVGQQSHTSIEEGDDGQGCSFEFNEADYGFQLLESNPGDPDAMLALSCGLRASGRYSESVRYAVAAFAKRQDPLFLLHAAHAKGLVDDVGAAHDLLQLADRVGLAPHKLHVLDRRLLKTLRTDLELQDLLAERG